MLNGELGKDFSLLFGVNPQEFRYCKVKFFTRVFSPSRLTLPQGECLLLERWDYVVVGYWCD